MIVRNCFYGAFALATGLLVTSELHAGSKSVSVTHSQSPKSGKGSHVSVTRPNQTDTSSAYRPTDRNVDLSRSTGRNVGRNW